MSNPVIRLIGALAVLLLATLYCLAIPSHELVLQSSNLWLFFLLIPSVALLGWGRWLWAILVLLLAFAGQEASLYKIALTQMPITFQDLQIAFANPTGFWEALSMRWYVRYSTYAGLLIIAILLLWSLWTEVWSLKRSSPNTILLYLIFGIAWSMSFSIFTNTNYAALKKDPSTAALFAPEPLVKLSKVIGIFSFIDFTRHDFLDQQSQGDFFNKSILALAKDVDLVRSSFSSSVDASIKENKKPNIVFMLLESTFDPGRYFHLKGEASSKLFTANAYTKLLASLYVNAVGGGTWITEFETITGMDSRIFGSYGYYTHSSISPHIRRSFATYLNEMGYETMAFYPVPGDFYNAKNAYRNYGFKHFFEVTDIGLSSSWAQFTDKIFVEKLLPTLSSYSTIPFFAYVVTLENHGPHRCPSVKSSDRSAISLEKSSNNSLNCQLNEYNRRLYSTEQSVFEMLDFLKKTERDTGRPFVLAVFGDHLPHTFVSTLYGSDFSPYRTGSSQHETFLHIMSSVKKSLVCCQSKTVPTALLPTLVSTLIVDPFKPQAFLSTNLDLYKKCGTNAIEQFHAIDKDIERGGCEEQYARSLKIYQHQLSSSFR